jgi:hypothetical protein
VILTVSNLRDGHFRTRSSRVTVAAVTAGREEGEGERGARG